MRKKDAAKIVATTAAASAMFVGLVAFRLAKGVVLIAQILRSKPHRSTAQPRSKAEPGEK